MRVLQQHRRPDGVPRQAHLRVLCRWTAARARIAAGRRWGRTTGAAGAAAVVGVAGLILVGLGPAAPASATVTGDCTVSIAGTPLAGRPATPAHAIRIGVDDEIVVEAQARTGGPYEVRGEIAGVGVVLAHGTADGRTWSEVIDVDRYGRYSLGLHRVEVTAPGCRAAALVRIGGHPPVLSAASIGSMVAVALGLISVVQAWSRGRRPSRTRTRPYRVSQPFEHLDDLRTAGEYVSWAEVLGDHRGRALVDEAPANDEVVERIRQPEVQERLQGLSRAGIARFPLFSATDPVAAVVAVATLLPRLHWRPRFPVVGSVLAALGGVGVMVLLQQLSVDYPAPGEVALAAAGALALELVVANLARMTAIRRANRSLGRAESALVVAEDEPLYPPFEHTEAQWQPTHAVPPTGLPAWTAPDPAAPPVTHLDGRLPVEVVQRAGEWAWIHCSNGWTGWVDGRLLVPLDAPPPAPPEPSPSTDD